MQFRAKTDKNRKLLVNWDLVNAYLSKWKPDTLLEVEIKRHEKKISLPMRKYYFSAVLPKFSRHLGYEPEEDELLHRQLKITYFGIQADAKGIYRKVPSVFSNESEVVISKKSEFVEWVKRLAAKEGVYISDPGESE